MLLALVLLLPVLLILYLEISTLREKRLLKRVPGPPTIPLLGNAHQIGNNPHVTLVNLFKYWGQFKDNYLIWIGYIPNVIITQPKDVEFVLTSNTLIDKSDVYHMLYPWLGTGLLTSTGSKWFKRRKMITPSFHFKILQDFHDIMNTNSNKFIGKLREASAGDTIFDFQEMVHYLTLDVICDTAMGVNINAMDNPDGEVVQAFKDICYNINSRAFHPLKRKNSLYRFYPDYANFKRTLKVLQDFTNDVIEKRSKALNELDSHAAAGQDDNEFSRRKTVFLDTLLRSTIDGKPLTQYDVYEEVSTFMFEGHDTTTSAMAFGIYVLSRAPEIQRKVYEEQATVMNGNMKRDATFQEISEMKYLDLVVKEVLRLYPSVPLIGRFTEKDYDMGDYVIPMGSSVNLFIIGLGYDEKTFADPYKVDPERFNVDNQTEKQNPFAYVPFSAGPRNCIGQKFALLEVKTVISKIVRSFEILPPLDELIFKDGYVDHRLGQNVEDQKKHKPHKYDPILSTVVTLKSENGIHLRMRERK